MAYGAWHARWFVCSRKRQNSWEMMAQVSVDVAWSPVGIDYRFYDYKGLADASDFLFVMAYDMQSQVRK